MRDIKFRAWDLHNQRMVEDPYMFEPWQDFRGENNYGASFVFFEDWHDVEDGIARPCHIMQFTGLRDRNGREIYEGDIVEALSDRGFDHGNHKGEAFEVFWFKENGAWYIQRKYREEENMSPLVFCNEMVANCDLEVIGNIYENTDLIK